MSNRVKRKGPLTSTAPPPPPPPPPIGSEEWGRIHREETLKALMSCAAGTGPCESSIHVPGCWVGM